MQLPAHVSTSGTRTSMGTQVMGPAAAQAPVVTDPNVYVPKFRSELVDANGRVFGVEKVPQTSMFKITATGQGDTPHVLKGTWTSTRLAENAVKAYLLNQKREANAEQPSGDVREEPVQSKEVTKEGESKEGEVPAFLKTEPRKTLSLKSGDVA